MCSRELSLSAMVRGRLMKTIEKTYVCKANRGTIEAMKGII